MQFKAEVLGVPIFIKDKRFIGERQVTNKGRERHKKWQISRQSDKSNKHINIKLDGQGRAEKYKGSLQRLIENGLTSLEINQHLDGFMGQLSRHSRWNMHVTNVLSFFP